MTDEITRIEPSGVSPLKGMLTPGPTPEWAKQGWIHKEFHFCSVEQEVAFWERVRNDPEMQRLIKMNQDNDRLEQSKCRHSMATPGPWTAEGGIVMSPTTGEILCDGEWFERELGEGFTDNESFVVHSWEDVKWLIEEVERLREQTETPAPSPPPTI